MPDLHVIWLELHEAISTQCDDPRVIHGDKFGSHSIKVAQKLLLLQLHMMQEKSQLPRIKKANVLHQGRKHGGPVVMRKVWTSAHFDAYVT